MASDLLLRGRPPLLLLPCLLLLLASSPCPGHAAVRFIYNLCPPGSGNFTGNSAYEGNVRRLLASVSSNAPATGGYYNDTVGRAPDQVYGLALCRGDLTAAQCQECVDTAVQGVLEKCPNSKGATVWYDPCLLRYSNESFFGSSGGIQVSEHNSNNVSDAATFDRLLGGLLDELTARATGSPRKFAAGEVSYTSFIKIYGLVQCTRDLSANECDRCLRERIGSVPSCCEGKQGAKVMVGSCFLRYEVAPFYNATAAADPVSVPAASPPPATDATLGTTARSGKKDNALPIALAIAIPLLVIVSLSAITTFCICLNLKRKKKRREANAYEEETGLEAHDEQLSFDLVTLKLATNDFAESNKLGEGGFGVVYKGSLPNGLQIATKRLSKGSGQGLGELKNEVALVAKLQHRNLVRFLGCCVEDGEALLVYEYMQNKSLDSYLFDPAKSKDLHWESRLRIIEGTARGLLYLHEDSRLKIIHRDLKASNILLDEEMTPKISDFGLARLFGNEQTKGNTSKIAGTYGYMAPEYVMHGQISVKSDVYSFGILILEIITGRKCVSYDQSSNPLDLLSYVWQQWEKGDALQVLDLNVPSGYSTQAVLRCIHIGLLCVQHDAYKRPTMSSVVLMLSSQSVTLPAVSAIAYSAHASASLGGGGGRVPDDDGSSAGYGEMASRHHVGQVSNAATPDTSTSEPR